MNLNLLDGQIAIVTDIAQGVVFVLPGRVLAHRQQRHGRRGGHPAEKAAPVEELA